MVWRLLPENMVCLFPFPEVFVNVLPQGLSFSLHTDARSVSLYKELLHSLKSREVFHCGCPAVYFPRPLLMAFKALCDLATYGNASGHLLELTSLSTSVRFLGEMTRSKATCILSGRDAAFPGGCAMNLPSSWSAVTPWSCAARCSFDFHCPCLLCIVAAFTADSWKFSPPFVPVALHTRLKILHRPVLCLLIHLLTLSTVTCLVLCSPPGGPPTLCIKSCRVYYLPRPALTISV